MGFFKKKKYHVTGGEANTHFTEMGARMAAQRQANKKNKSVNYNVSSGDTIKYGGTVKPKKKKFW